MSIVDLATGLSLEDVRIANELAEEDDLFSQVVKFSTDGIIVASAEGIYTLWNPAMEKVSGMSKQDVLGRHWLDVFPNFRGTSIEEAFNKALKGMTVVLPPFPYEVGEAKGFTEQKNTPIFDEANKLVGVLVVVRDVTESMRVLEALQQENRILRERGLRNVLRRVIARIAAKAGLR